MALLYRFALFGAAILINSAVAVQLSSQQTNLKASSTGVHVRNQYDIDVILNGVGKIYSPDVLGFLSVYGPNAFPVVAAPYMYSEDYHPIIAAGRLGKGRVVGGTNGQLFTPEEHDNADSGRNKLILNLIEWTRRDGSDSRNLRVGNYIDWALQGDNNRLHTFLKKYNISSSDILDSQLTTAAGLRDYDAIFVSNFLTEKSTTIFEEYLKEGGGLVIAQHTWQWDHDGHFGADYLTNHIVSQAGFVWRNKHWYGRSEENMWSTDLARLKNTHVLDAWKRILELQNNFNDNLNQCWSVVDEGLNFIPPTDSFWVQSNFYTDAIHLLLRKTLQL